MIITPNAKEIITFDDIGELKKDLDNAAKSMGLQEHLQYTFKQIQRYLSSFENAWLGIINQDINEEIDGFSYGYKEQQYKKMVSSAKKYAVDAAPTIQVMKQHKKQVIAREDYWPYEKFRESNFFLNHSRHFGQHHLIGIADNIGFSGKIMFLSLYNSEPSMTFKAKEMAFLQEISLPLLDIWKCKLGIYNSVQSRLSERSIKKYKFSEFEAKVVNLLLREPYLTNKELATYLNKEKAKAIDGTLERVYSKMDIQTNKRGNKRKAEMIYILQHEK